jgi:DNA-binding transcriptional LysR family regulator
MVSLCIQREGVMLAMRHDHPLASGAGDASLTDLEGEPLIMFGTINGAGFNERLFAECEALGFQPNVALEAVSFATLLGLTAAGLGITIMSRSLSRLNVDTLKFRPLAVPFTSQLLMLHMKSLSPTASKFRDMIAAVAE